MRTLVIAEPGATWERDLEQAYRSIAIAKECDADCWKAQWVSDPVAMANRRHAPALADKYRHYLGWPEAWLYKLKAKCDEVGIDFMCTTYLPQDVHIVSPLVSRLKIASFEFLDKPFFWENYREAKDCVIVSTGMSTVEDVEVLAENIPNHERVNFLHCVSAYPAPLEEMNLRVLLRPNYEFFKGISDHTQSAVTGGYAVAAGSTILEKHFRLVNTPESNPDYPHSLDPGLFRKYVLDVRWAEKLMGSQVKRCQPSEKESSQYRVVIDGGP